MTQNTENQLTVMKPQPTAVGFASAEGFELMQRIATAFTSSTLVPDTYRGADKKGNALIAIELANRIGASPLMVMQNLHVIHGRPSFSSTFIISAINTCGTFGPLRFRMTGQGDDQTCVAYATERASGEVLEGPPVSIKMAKAEGWYGKNGSKWPTMPDLMLRYRAAAFFGRLYAPEILMGMRSDDEIVDMGVAEDVTDQAPRAEVAQQLNAGIADRASRKKRTVIIEATAEPAVQPEPEPQPKGEEPATQTPEQNAGANGAEIATNDSNLF